MNNEAEKVDNLIKEVNAAQKIIWDSLTRAESIEPRKRFRAASRELCRMGYGISYEKRKDADGKCVCGVWSAYKRHTDFIYFDPPHTHNNQCTTRAFNYITGENYEQIRREQETIAKENHWKWNTTYTSNEFLYRRGYSKISVRRIRAGELARILKDYRGVMRSTRHLAAFDKGMIVDCYYSLDKIVKEVFVKTEVSTAASLVMDRYNLLAGKTF